MNLGIVARMDSGGLAYQTRNLVRMLHPTKLMVIDSSIFNGAAQHPGWYEGYDRLTINGFPSDNECAQFLTGLTHVITCETPYNYNLFELTRQRRIVSVLAPNPEFLDYYQQSGLPQPAALFAPSSWHLSQLQSMFPKRVHLLPPPTFAEDFAEVRDKNHARTGDRRRFLHVVGRPAIHDRNGTLSVLDALKQSTADFELVIKLQRPMDLPPLDSRVTVDLSGPDDRAELYRDFDAMLLPRRYGGLSLPLCEALMSGLPVIMTAISPNDDVLTAEWLIPAAKSASFMCRTEIDVYSADPAALAAKLDELCSMSDEYLRKTMKQAVNLGHCIYSPDVLNPRYTELLA